MKAEDVSIMTAINYVPLSLTKDEKGPHVAAPVVKSKGTEPKAEQPKENVMDACGNATEVLDLSLISVDRTYQRSLKKHHKKIAKNIDLNAVGHPVVNRRPDKSLWSIDGQQRIAALKLKGYTHWPCRVVNLKTVEEEAELFGRLNGSEGTQAAVSQRDRWRALIAAKNAHALACVEAVSKGGMELVNQRHPGNPEAWRELDCTSFIMGMASVHGYESVTRGARILSESWQGVNDAGRYLVVGGIMRMVAEYPDMDDDRAITRFRKMPAIRVEQEARKAATFKASGSLPFLISLYNKGLKSRRLEVQKPRTSDTVIRDHAPDSPARTDR